MITHLDSQGDSGEFYILEGNTGICQTLHKLLQIKLLELNYLITELLGISFGLEEP